MPLLLPHNGTEVNCGCPFLPDLPVMHAWVMGPKTSLAGFLKDGPWEPFSRES